LLLPLYLFVNFLNSNNHTIIALLATWIVQWKYKIRCIRKKRWSFQPQTNHSSADKLKTLLGFTWVLFGKILLFLRFPSLMKVCISEWHFKTISKHEDDDFFIVIDTTSYFNNQREVLRRFTNRKMENILSRNSRFFTHTIKNDRTSMIFSFVR
jgi:hypothetical protein